MDERTNERAWKRLSVLVKVGFGVINGNRMFDNESADNGTNIKYHLARLLSVTFFNS